MALKVDEAGMPIPINQGNYPSEYSSWQWMRRTAFDQTDHRWRDSFAEFVLDMGAKPSPAHRLVRFDRNCVYEAGNCQWMTQLEQAPSHPKPVAVAGSRSKHDWEAIEHRIYGLGEEMAVIAGEIGVSAAAISTMMRRRGHPAKAPRMGKGCKRTQEQVQKAVQGRAARQKPSQSQFFQVLAEGVRTILP